jgi:hypothetical protein
MVIKVSFSKKIDTADPKLPLVVAKFFEVDAMPEKPTIIRKLKEMGCECHPASLSVEIHDQDAVMMRSSGILVLQLCKNATETAANAATSSYVQEPTFRQQFRDDPQPARKRC